MQPSPAWLSDMLLSCLRLVHAFSVTEGSMLITALTECDEVMAVIAASPLRRTDILNLAKGLELRYAHMGSVYN